MRFRRALLRLLCALLLFAQQSALTHAIGHAAAGQAMQRGADATYQGERTPVPDFAALCVFDTAFGQALGFGLAPAPVPLLEVAGSVAIIHLSRPHTAAETLTPRSRGPPVLL